MIGLLLSGELSAQSKLWKQHNYPQGLLNDNISLSVSAVLGWTTEPLKNLSTLKDDFEASELFFNRRYWGNRRGRE